MLADFSGKPFRCSENDKVGIAKLHERNLGEARISAVYDIITHFSQNAYDAFSAAPGRGDCCGVVEDDNILKAHARSFFKKKFRALRTVKRRLWRKAQLLLKLRVSAASENSLRHIRRSTEARNDRAFDV